MKRKIALSTVCRTKKKFRNGMISKARSVEINKESNIILYHYKCNVCDGWHLTKKNKEERKEIELFIMKTQAIHDDEYEGQKLREAEYWANKKKWLII